MFLGQYHHNLDSKSRLTIPSRYRDMLEEGAYVVQGFDGNLIVYTAPAFEQIKQQASQLSVTDQTTRLLNRLIFSTADYLEVDKAGRILIPEFLRQEAGLKDEVVLAGGGDYFEVWSPERWAEQITQLHDPSAISQRFAALKLSTSP
jgi:MraZ protein